MNKKIICVRYISVFIILLQTFISAHNATAQNLTQPHGFYPIGIVHYDSSNKEEIRVTYHYVSTKPDSEIEKINSSRFKENFQSDSIKIDSICKITKLRFYFYYSDEKCYNNNNEKIRKWFNSLCTKQEHILLGPNSGNYTRLLLAKNSSSNDSLNIAILVTTANQEINFEHNLGMFPSSNITVGIIDFKPVLSFGNSKKIERKNILFIYQIKKNNSFYSIQKNLSEIFNSINRFSASFYFEKNRIRGKYNCFNEHPTLLVTNNGGNKQKSTKSQIKSKEPQATTSNMQLESNYEKAPIKSEITITTGSKIVKVDTVVDQSPHDTIRRKDSLYRNLTAWQHCESLVEADIRQPDPNRGKKIRKILDTLISKSYHKSTYDSLSIFIKKRGTLRYINDTFLNKLTLAECYEKAGDMENAYLSYHWLIYNWLDNNPYLSRKECMARFQEMQFLTLRFDDSIELNQRIFKEFGENETIEHIFAAIRAKYSLPVFNIIQYLCKRANTKDNVVNVLNSASSRIPFFVQAIYLLDNNKKITMSMFKKNAPFVPGDLKGGSSVSFRIEDSRLYIYSRIDKASTIVMQIELTPSQKQSAYMINVKKDQGSANAWRQIEDWETAIYGLISSLFSKSLEITMTEGVTNFSDVWTSTIRGCHFIPYAVKYDPSGKVTFNKGFELQKSQFSENMYLKSSRTMAYFEQQIEYAGRSLVDISNPVFNASTFTGTVRVGFYKN